MRCLTLTAAKRMNVGTLACNSCLAIQTTVTRILTLTVGTLETLCAGEGAAGVDSSGERRVLNAERVCAYMHIEM